MFLVKIWTPIDMQEYYPGLGSILRFLIKRVQLNQGEFSFTPFQLATGYLVPSLRHFVNGVGTDWIKKELMDIKGFLLLSVYLIVKKVHIFHLVM